MKNYHWAIGAAILVALIAVFYPSPFEWIRGKVSGGQ